MDRLLSRIFLLSLVLSALGWWKQDDLVPLNTTPEALLKEPKQRATRTPPFEAHFRDVDYKVLPQYGYELVGRVVSLRYHTSKFGLHQERWNDHVNVADFCVVWGENATELDLSAFKFWNLQFTCNWKTRNQTQWQKFRSDQISNNHIVSDDIAMREALSETRVGDVIRIKGMLAHYGEASRADNQLRRTSTVRTDTGNGACETIWITEFERLAEMPNVWRRLLPASLLVLAVSGIWWLIGVGSGSYSRHH